MSEPTPDLRGAGPKDEQPTLLQWPHEAPAVVMQTGIKAASEAPRLEVGPVPLTRIAHYELIKEVGRGGMGVVFKARDVKLNRIVALKVIRGGALANSDELQRFDKEATAAAQLQHPNIVALFDCDVHNQQPYLSMEFIGGTSLSERLSLGPLSGRRAAEYLELTARAVHYAHTRGIVHRDLKPANVLLDENDQPKVTDFGLAKQMETDSDQTRTGAVLGTPSYMSPEQAEGRKDIGPASDVYSLGAIIYELITGKPPFCGETPLATLNLVVEQEPIPPRVLTPTVDRDLETICLKCLEKSPARRYDSAESLADDLHRYLQGEPITARRVNFIGRAVKWVRRNPAWSVLTTASVLSVAAFMIFSWYEVYIATDLRQQAVKANDLAAVRLETMRHLLYLSEMRQAQQTLRRADLDGGSRILNEHWQPKEGVTDLRDWEWYFLKDRAENRLAFGSHHGRAFAVAYQPDGKKLASAGGEFNRDGEIKIWDLRTGKLLQTLTGHKNAVTTLAYHPEKPILASGSFDKTVKLWDLKTGKEIVTLLGHTDNVNSVAFSPNGERLASASRDLSVRVWDHARYASEPDASVIVLKGHEKPVTSVAFHPDYPKRQLLASGSSDRTVKSGSSERAIKLWNLETGQLDRNLTAPEGELGDVESLTFSANGKLLISGGGQGSQRGEMLVWDAETGKLRGSHYGLSDRIFHVAASRDGKIAAAGADGLLRIWNHNASSEPLVFRADPQTITGVAFAPDGFSLATTGDSGRVSLWNSSAGSETLTLAAPGSMKSIAFNPKGPYLATAGAPRGEVRVWNLDQPDQPMPPILGHKGSVFCIAFSPDGKYLASGGGDHTARIVDFLNPDKPAVILEALTARVHALAYRPDGNLIASAGEDAEIIHLHDPATGKLLKTLEGHDNGILCLAFSPDGVWLASGSYDKTVRLWNLDTGKDYRLDGHTMSVNAVAFNPNGLTLASASSDKSIRVWTLEKRELAFKLEGAPGPVQSLAYHPGGGRLASIAQDRMIRIWDVVTRQEILEFEEHVGTLRCVAFSADGRSLAGAGNGVVRVWQASKEILDVRR